MGDKCHKMSAGKWTQLKKSSGKLSRMANRSGWSEEGIHFYKNSRDFFQGVRKHHGFTSYRQIPKSWYLMNVVQEKNERAQRRSVKRRRLAGQALLVVLSFEDWDTDVLWTVSS